MDDPSTLDLRVLNQGQSLNMVNLVYNQVIRADPQDNTKIVGQLARSWEVDAAGTIYTFRLQDNVRWHDRRPLTAEDVKASYELLLDPKTGNSNNRGLLGTVGGDIVEAIEAVDAQTYRIKLKRPIGSLIARLSAPEFSIIPAHVVKAGGSLDTTLVGTGAYKFVEYRRGASFRVERNPDYFVKGLPYLDGIIVYPVAEEATRIANIRTQRVDQFTRWAAVGPKSTAQLSQNSSIKIDIYPRLTNVNLVFNTEKAPWNDVRARRAVSLALDRNKAITLVGEGLGYLSVLPLLGDAAISPEELAKKPGFRQPKAEDIAEAQRLWKEAGVAQGADASILTTTSPDYLSRAALLLQETLQQLGANASIQTQEFVTYSRNRGQGNFQLVTANAANIVPVDPDGLSPHFGGTGTALNWKTPPRALELFQKQSQTLDTKERVRLIREIQDVWMEEVPSIAMYGVNLVLPRWEYVRNYVVGLGTANNGQYDTVWMTR